MKKLDVPMVQNENGDVGIVINHTKHKDYVHVIEIGEDKIAGITKSWRTDSVTPWEGNVIISNHKKRII